MLVEDRFALNRLAFGASPHELSQRKFLLSNWLDDQLSPRIEDDAELIERLKTFRLRVKYGDSKEGVDEMRPMQWLDSPIESLWELADPAKSIPPQEKARPHAEVAAATLLRAVYSRWQLKEVLCDFWHNHFSVNADDQHVSIALPVYDREVIRRHCFGNFREMLEAVASSPAMLWYLNNRSSRTGAPNENYAREFFELHTLGRDAYLNAYYNHWKDVPGAAEGRPIGYIDQDVYEAARAFTGWTVADGSGLGAGQSLPRSGRFTYVESWHDNYQKRILATDIDPFQPAMSDGHKVIELAASHPATAHFLAKKLCIRLVADTPPESLVSSTARLWIKSQNKPNQIALTIRHIVHSKEFARSRNAKVKRPLELVASYVRATGIDFTPTAGLIGEMRNAGQSLFAWPTPAGHPDNASQWLGPNSMRRRWTLIAGLTENWWSTGILDPLSSVGDTVNSEEFIKFWIQRLSGKQDKQMETELLDTAGLMPDGKLNNAALARHLVAWAAMSPEYQLR